MYTYPKEVHGNVDVLALVLMYILLADSVTILEVFA